MQHVAASVFPVDAAADFIDAITGALSDNIGVVLAVLGFSVGLGFVFRLFNKSVKGKI